MTENEDLEIDPAVAEAMGFSSFGMQSGKRRKLNADTAFIDPQTTAEGGQGHSKHANTTASKHTTVGGSSDPRGPTQMTPQSSIGERLPNRETATGGAAATTTPTKSTNTAMNIDLNDERSLQTLAYGVRNENGDMVYFQRSFLEDPWRGLKPK